jgi:hypothetical protein
VNPAPRAMALTRTAAAALAVAIGAIALFPATPDDAEAAAARESRGALVLNGGVPGEAYGCSVAAAGDVNGDGYDDVIAGAYQSARNGLAVGRAYVYYGSRRPVNHPDVALIGEAAGDAFGVCVASAGDMNHDGYADVIVGAYQNDGRGANAGRAYVYFGGPSLHERPDLVLNGDSAGDAFGYAVSSAGDVNGDGFADVVVGAYENSARGAGAGRAYVFFGSARPDAVPDLVLSGEAAGDRFGISVACAGDVNRDGFADVIVGAYQNDAGGVDAGRAYIYFGGQKPDDHPDEVLTGASAGDSFGFSVAGVGDVNHDGFADVTVGAYHNAAGGKDAGRAYVYQGSVLPMEHPALVLTGEAAGDAFGYAVSPAGDVNGDGFADVAVGAYGNDAGGSAAGKAYVYYGGATDAAPDFTLAGESTLDNLGFAVSGAGDVDGDGFADLVVGAPYSDADAGRAYLARALAGRARPVAKR